MFRFESPEHFSLLLLVLVILTIFIFYFLFRRRQLKSIGHFGVVERLIPNYSSLRIKWKMSFLLLAMLFLTLAMTNPQWGTKKEKVKVSSSDIFIAMDISQSMMAEDISPNRLERAKRLTQNIIRSLRGNRIGIILFAGNAYLQMPLSNDFSAAQMFISSANTNQATTQGTAIGEAINLATNTYTEGDVTQRALVILTDGESHDEEALEIAESAHDQGLNIFTIGVGTEDGAYIPVKSKSGNQYKRNDDGNLVKTSLNPNLVRDIASAGGGKHYFIQENNDVVTDLRRQIDRIEKQVVEQRSFSDYESYFQWFIGLGLILIILEYLLPTKNEKRALNPEH